jgi:hypothetical protein
VTLNARPFTDWRFAGWSGACSGAGSCLLDMRSDASVVATFEHVADGECTGLTPLDPGAPWTLSVPASSEVYSCFPGAVDGNGAVAVGGQRPDGTFLFSFFTFDGKRSRRANTRGRCSHICTHRTAVSSSSRGKRLVTRSILLRQTGRSEVTYEISLEPVSVR